MFLTAREQGSMLPLLRHEVDLWLKTVWGLLKPCVFPPCTPTQKFCNIWGRYEERMTLDAFKCALLLLRFSA